MTGSGLVFVVFLSASILLGFDNNLIHRWILTGVLFLSNIELISKRFNIHKGSITLALDGESALKAAQGD